MTLRAFLLLAALAGPAAAEGRSEAFLDLAARVPTAALHPVPGGASVTFADLAAAKAVLLPLPPGLDPAAAAATGPITRVSLRTQTPNFAIAAILGLDGGWEPLVGFAPLDIEAALSFGTPPEGANVLRLDPAVAGRVEPALLANGYRREERDGVAALVRGGEDGGMDLGARNLLDPFGGSMGLSSRVALDGEGLVHSAFWGPVLGAMGAGGPQGHPDLSALGAALDAPLWGEARLLQAFTLPHQLDLGVPGSEGLPPWRLGLVADLGTPEEAVTLALFSYGTAAEAEAASARLAEGWDEPVRASFFDPAGLLAPPADDPSALGLADPPGPSLRDLTGSPVETGVTGEGPFVAWAALRGAPVVTAPGTGVVDAGFEALAAAVDRRELWLFGPP